MEKRFTLNHGEIVIPCKIYVPDSGSVRRCIIGVHGFGVSKDVPVLASIAEEMGIFGFATVRFDFPAHGESPMSDRYLTLRNCCDVLAEVTRWTQDIFPDSEICIYASGFGAYVTLLALEELDEITGRVRLVLQTPNIRMADSLLAMTRMTEEEFRAQGRVFLKAERGFEVSFNFYQELKNNVAMTTYPVPMLLLHGEMDYVVKLEDMRHFRRINDLTKLVIIPGADHQFRTQGAWDMVVDLTRDWFEYEQVLLCDWE